MKVLLVEDEAQLAQMLRRGLMEEGHEVDCCPRGEDGLAQARQVPYDVIVLDWGLPDVDGLSVLRQWRRSGLRTPVLMLTARGSTAEKVLGLRTGADDYLVKPFDFDELLARLEALLRRGEAGDSGPLGPVQVDARALVLRLGEREEPLTRREHQLLQAFARGRGEVLSRFELLQRVWGKDFDGEPNVVDVYVGYLRAKLERLGATGVEIRTVRGTGYRLVVEEPR
jgi:two-component system OmpR family response regulator